MSDTMTLKALLFGQDVSMGKTFDNAGDKADKAKGKMKAWAVGGAAVAGAAIVKFGSDSIKAYSESEESQKRLTFAFQKFPAMASTSQAELQKLNSELQKKTRFDDDNIASGQAVLAQFKLTGTQVKDVTPLLLDYASATGKDIPGAAQDVGKALLGNAKALKNIGIAYKSTGDPVKDYANITDLMRKKVGGFANNEAKTAAGRTAILKNQFGELEETAGSKLVPALTKVTAAGLAMVTWIQNNTGKVKALAIGIGILGVAIGIARGLTLAHNAAMAVSAAGGIRAFLMSTKLAAAGQWLLNAALSANPIGIVIVIIAALVAGIILAYKHSETFRRIVSGAFEAISNAAKWMWNNVVAPVIRFLLNAFASVASFYAKMLRGLAKIPGFGWAKNAADMMDSAGRKARELASGVKSIPSSKKVTVTVTGRVTGGRLKVNGQSVNIGMFAGGGRPPVGMPSIVGEEGPEFFVPDTAGTIYSARDSARMLAGASRGGAAVGGGSEQPLVVQFMLDGRMVQQSLLRVKRQGGVSLGLA